MVLLLELLRLAVLLGSSDDLMEVVCEGVSSREMSVVADLIMAGELVEESDNGGRGEVMLLIKFIACEESREGMQAPEETSETFALECKAGKT